MLIPIGDRISISGYAKNLDARFGPYASIQDAHNTISANYNVVSGLQFGILEEDGTVTIYEFTKNGGTVNDVRKLTFDSTLYYTKNEVDGKGYLTEHQSLSNYYTRTEIDGKGYLTSHQSLSDYYTKSEVNSTTGALSDRVTALENNVVISCTLEEFATMVANNQLSEGDQVEVSYQDE